MRMKPKGVAIVLAACLVGAAAAFGAAAAARALRNSAAPSPPHPIAAGPTVPSPSTSPSSKTFRQALGPACLVRHVRGDFDGDRMKDEAFSWMPEPSGGCPSDPPFGPFVLTVFRANGRARVDLRMTDRCDGRNCGFLAKADLNGDGKSELAAVIWTGAADDFYRVFGFVDRRLVALPVAPPGAKGYPAGAPIELDVGGSALIQSYVTCEETDERGGIVLLAHRFAGDTNQPGWVTWVHWETGFRFDGRAFIVLYQDGPETFPPSYDPSRDPGLVERRCWSTLP
jgi:hypothetical protein